MLNINRYPVFPNGYHKKESGFGPLSGPLVEKYDARYALDPHTLVGDAIFGTPTILWIDGDGPTPTVSPNPLLTLATSGVVLPGQPMPHTYPSGIDATGEEYDGTSWRADVVNDVNPTDTDDIVVACKHRMSPGALAGGYHLHASTFRNPGGTLRGWFVYDLGNYMGFSMYSAGGFRDVLSTGFLVPGSPGITVAVANRNGNMQAWHNMLTGAQEVTPLGANNGNGFAVGAATNGAAPVRAGARLEWVAAWYGAGLWEAWTASSNRLVKLISSESMGLRETVSRKLWSFARGEKDCCAKDGNDRWWLYPDNAPRAGNSKGLYVGTSVVNSAGGNFYGGLFPVNLNPPDTTGWAVTGGVVAAVNDAAALLVAKCEAWGPNVYRFTNATGVVQTVYGGIAPVGGSWVSFALLARYEAGAGATVGTRDSGTGVYTPFSAVLGGYGLTLWSSTQLVGNTSQFAIQIPDGCTLLFIAQTYGVTRRLDLPISCWNANNRAPDFATTEHTPADASDSILVRITPTGWSGIECAADTMLLTRATVAADILHAESVAAGWATGDGAVQIQTVAPAVPTDGVRVDVWAAWKLALQYVQQGVSGVTVTGVYDGAKGGTGFLQATADTGPYRLDWIEIRSV